MQKGALISNNSTKLIHNPKFQAEECVQGLPLVFFLRVSERHGGLRYLHIIVGLVSGAGSTLHMEKRGTSDGTSYFD